MGQCIFHICLQLLDSPPKGDTRMYRPDSGFADGRGGRSGGRDSGRDRRDRSPDQYGGNSGNYGSSFEAIAEFARRQRGGERSRADSRERDTSFEMTVPNDVIGAVIGKRGAKINEIRQISGATINILERDGGKRGERSPDQDRDRVIEICGSQTAVALAKSMVSIAMDIGGGSESGGRGRSPGRDDRRSGRFARTRSRSRDRYEDRRGRGRDKFAPY